MTAAEKQEIIDAVLAEISTRAQDLESAQVLTTTDGVTSIPVITNGNVVARIAVSALTPDANKAVDVTVPTESTVTGWGFTKNGGTVTSTGGTVAVNNIQVVSTLPASPDANTLYLIPES